MIPQTGPLNFIDINFQALKVMETPPSPTLTRAPRPQWMLERSLRLIDAQADYHRWTDHNGNVACALTRSVQQSLVVYTFRRIEVTVDEIGDCLEYPQGTPLDLQGMYSVLKWWYQHTTVQKPHPSRTDLEKV